MPYWTGSAKLDVSKWDKWGTKWGRFDVVLDGAERFVSHLPHLFLVKELYARACARAHV